MRHPSNPSTAFLPCLAVGVCSALWGAFWIPLRMLEDDGVSGPWTILFLYGVASLIIFPFVLKYWGVIRAAGWNWVVTGLLGGGGFYLYANSFLNTEIVRALLLFYLMSIWATILGRLILGESITLVRFFAIALGLGGMFVMLGIDLGWPVPRNVGDWMALVAGMMWAYTCVRYRQAPEVGAIEQTFGFTMGCVVWGLVFLLIPTQGPGIISSFGALDNIVWLVLGVTAVIAIATNLLIIWGARQISPGLVGLFNMMELVAGAATAAWLSGEPFGWREIVGGTLIVAAALVDIMMRRDPAMPKAIVS
jgi:drug/metabolite transporter (DMT)-like permease